MVRVAKHDDRLDPAVEQDGDVIRRRVHDARALGVANQGKLLVRASNGLGLEAAHNVNGAHEGSADDVGAGGILVRWS